MSVAKSKSALKRAFKDAANHHFGMAGINVVRALRMAAKAQASEDEMDEIAAVAQNLLKHIGDIADSAARAGRDVDDAAAWATRGLNDAYFSSVDEFSYNPRRR